ncbi:hypothetical protein BU24DRAFT_427448 [Aaosphaeria arxii CBS 175.79]|uniref:Atos-like conserved domain-containing protein n=1 Tax=Aaosphaeria arxii CBS 175.79 TaxID=1450172 RepID=A0A6A5XC17_9PLEO|nr:uncharacterized protein BU24DRAFT_427448 [Aaosphaeria arxii CBS 175.79]KAF2010324.1 hypothetical protein BU24DRAFT_427448 [Aaosphaeria arxii CBS 175.79]
MPIFHDHREHPSQAPDSRFSPAPECQIADYPGDGVRGALQDNTYSHHEIVTSCVSTMEPTSPSNGRQTPILNRGDLIERIKSANSPSWPRSPNHGAHPEATSELPPISRERPKTPLLPAAEMKPTRALSPDLWREHASAGLEIERPRSALHSGDFREKKEEAILRTEPSSSSSILSTSPVAPWHHAFPASAIPIKHAESHFSFGEVLQYDSRPTSRSRATSQSSFSSSFVLMPPTSPLAQQSNNADLDFSSRPVSRQSSRSPERNNRRHTFSPHSFQTFRSMRAANSTSNTPVPRHVRREGTFPYQAHQPRRSLTSINHFQPHSSPQTPLIQSRRPSFSSDSPLHHAPMVGSYEESILRGRMSTTPSRPLDFVAQIGVLGRGLCKSSLRCPPHVTVPFPAVFYSYSGESSKSVNNSPSPYVGLIDLENSLPPQDEGLESKRKRRHVGPNPDHEDAEPQPTQRDSVNLSKEGIRKREKKKRRSTSPKAPPGGSYRIPQQGQLQIVIKNPNKTAVKLFLVPYDLTDMEPGQKTFIRQRSYSAGPIIDMPLTSRKNLGTDRPEAALSTSDDPNDRPILRYLIHIHICCPSKGRYYLYKSIRVVFANRVPDGKEKLRNEIQLPEPRYSTYKPSRDSLAQQAPSTAAVQLTAEKAYRRRSAAMSLSHQVSARLDGSGQRPPLPPPAVKLTGGSASFGHEFSSPMSAFEPIPFNLARNPSIDSRPVSRSAMDIDSDSPFHSRTNTMSPVLQATSPEQTPEMFEKLNRGDVGYGGNAWVTSPPSSPGPGLLARKLRGLDVQPDEGSG